MELTWESDFTLGTRVRLDGIHMLVYVSLLVAIDIFLVALLLDFSIAVLAKIKPNGVMRTDWKGDFA